MFACLGGIGASAPLASAADWSAPIDVSGGLKGLGAKVDFDPAGNAFVSWRNDSFASISVAPPGGPFGAALRPPTGSNESISRIDLEFDGAGNAIVAWTNGDGALKAARRSPGPSGAFGPAQTLGSGVDGDTFSVDVNAKGEALVGWVKATPDEVHVAYSPAGAASAAPTFVDQIVGDHSSEARSVFPVIDPYSGSGTSAAVIWAGDGDPWQAIAANVATASPFGTPTSLEPGPMGPSTVFAASNVAGQAVAAWRMTNQPNPAVSTRGPGGSFGAPVAQSGDPVSQLSVAIGANGTSAAAWNEQTPPPPESGCILGLVGAFLSQGPFTAGRAPLSTEDYNSTASSVAVGPDGSVLSAWRISDCEIGANQSEGIQAGFGANGGAHTFFYAKGADAVEPKVAFDSYGNAIALWREGPPGALKASRYVVNEPPKEEPPKEEPPDEEPPPGENGGAGGAAAGGASSAAPGPTPTPPKSLKCRKSTKKKVVKGKAKCVKKKRRKGK